MLAAAVAACQPPPRPFAGERSNPLVEPRQTGSVAVEEIGGLPPQLAEELRQAVADALQRRGVLASTDPGNRATYRLRGDAELAPRAAGEPARAYIEWELLDRRGAAAGSFVGTAELEPGAVAVANERALANIARQVAETTAPPAPRTAAPSRSGPIPVSVLPVEGAPGDAREVLAQALNVALRNRGLRVADGIDADGLLIFGDAQVRGLAGGREQVDLVWSVRWPDGRHIGTVTQSNTVPAGTLERSWARVAPAVAAGAAGGIVALVQQAQRVAPAP